MSDRIDLYEPTNTLKPVAENIWIVDGPEISFKGLPFPTRMTIIRLKNGDLFIHSPTPLSNSLKTEVDALGTVRHLVSSNYIHYWWIGEWKAQFPKSIAWASPNVRPRALKQGIAFDKDLGDIAEKEWAGEIDQIIIRGSRAIVEVEFFHKTSKTLILTDFIENFEPKRIHSKIMRFIVRIAGLADPDGKLPPDIYWSFLGNRDKLKSAVQHMIDWQPERIVIAHGKWFQNNAVEELRRAYRRIGPFA